jgi:hypothetical protein
MKGRLLVPSNEKDLWTTQISKSLRVARRRFLPAYCLLATNPSGPSLACAGLIYHKPGEWEAPSPALQELLQSAARNSPHMAVVCPHIAVRRNHALHNE